MYQELMNFPGIVYATEEATKTAVSSNHAIWILLGVFISIIVIPVIISIVFKLSGSEIDVCVYVSFAVIAVIGVVLFTNDLQPAYEIRHDETFNLNEFKKVYDVYKYDADTNTITILDKESK